LAGCAQVETFKAIDIGPEVWRWLSDDPDPRELLKPFAAEPMTMWPVSTRVNTPKNDDADLILPVVQADANWPPDGNSA
jgi:hypothetical protein